MSQNTENILTSLNITTQLPLDRKSFILNEDALSDLGTDNNLAFTYHNGLHVYCVEEKLTYLWREVGISEYNSGLLSSDFIYPDGLIVDNIDYSLKRYNFFKQNYALLDSIKTITSTNGTVIINETPTTVDLSVIGSETKINSGTNVIVTGSGTTASPYIVNSNFYLTTVVDQGISLTGAGTSADPMIISLDNVQEIAWRRGDTKEVVCDSTYLSNNFEASGLGKNERYGWAIMNGATHGSVFVPDDNGRTVIAYGTNYPTLGVTGGSTDAVLINHSHSFPVIGGSGGLGVDINSTDQGGFSDTSVEGDSEDGINKNMQPYVVRLRIMKL